MEYYLGSVAIFYVALMLTGRTHALKAGVLIGMLPMIAVALLRGNVGTDTAYYLSQIRVVSAAGQLTGTFEPLFDAIILAFSGFFDDPRLVLALFGALTTFVLVAGGLRLERKPWIFALAILPQFYFDMTMNGIRYGLAFSFVYLAATYLVQGRHMRYWLLIAIATSFQLSGGALGLMLYALIERRWRAMIYCGVIAVIVMVVFRDYLAYKMEAYSSLEAESGTAGLGPLVISLMTLAFWMTRGSLRRGTELMVATLFLLTVFSFALSRFTYAGIRLQQLIVFLIFIALACHVRIFHLRLRSTTVLALFVIGALGFAMKLRNFQDGAYLYDSPFIPYHFYWEPQ